MVYPITAEQIRDNLSTRINEELAELVALKNVKIDTKHKTLTNRAISGEGARIGDCISIGKALFVSYTVKRLDGGTQYASREITAYSYNNLDGTEIGVNGCMRISRTITPLELAEILKDVIESKASFIGDLQSECRRAETIANKHNALATKINEYNDGLSYASKAQI